MDTKELKEQIQRTIIGYPILNFVREFKHKNNVCNKMVDFCDLDMFDDEEFKEAVYSSVLRSFNYIEEFE